MSRYAIHALGEAQIQRVVSCPQDHLQWQLAENQVGVLVDDSVSDATHYFDAGTLTAFPTKPDPTSTWSWETLAWSPPDLKILRGEKWEVLKAKREEVSTSPQPVRDFFIDADEVAQLNIVKSILAMQLGGLTVKNWRCADNVMRELTLEELIAAGLAINQRVQSCIETSDALYQQLQAAISVEQINAINWPST